MVISVTSMYIILEAIPLLTNWRPAHSDFSLDFYTEVQDLSYLENALSQSSPRYKALNMAICSLIEDFGLVGFETLAVEVSERLIPAPSPHPNIRILYKGQRIDAPSNASHRQGDRIRLCPSLERSSPSGDG